MCRLIPQESGRLAAKAGELLELLGAVASSLGAIPACGSHGDYAHDQVILARGRTVVCDWDTYVVADPARDVAKFIVHLERLAARHLGSLCALDGTADVFLKSYLAAGGLSQVTARLPFYKAVFRLVKELEVIDTKAPGWRERAQAALDDGFRALKQDGRIVPTLSGSRPRVPFPEGCRMKEPRCS
jgi:aminoglycoside phosphotransferase (APT) family kinase protein